MRVTRDISLCLSPRKSVFGPLFFSGDLDLGLRQSAALGYARVELSLLDSKLVDFGWLATTLQGLSLTVSAIATGQTFLTDRWSLFAPDKRSRDRCVVRLKGHCDLAARLGAAVIIGGIRGRAGGEGRSRDAILRAGKDALRECADYAAGKGVTLLLEPLNRYETNVVNTLRDGADLIDELGLRGVSLLADAFHMNIEEADPADAIRAAGDRIGYVHCADSNRLAPGWGHIDFAGIFGALAAIGYQGPIAVEALPRPDDISAARQSIDFLVRLVGRP
jgi:sugar phosphate isomerase/epimerase